MRWFGNRNCEGHEAETAEVKPKNQIIQTPEKVTPEAKEKPTKSWELSPEEKQKHNDAQAEIGKKYGKLERSKNTSDGGDWNTGQRQLERGHETER